MKSPRKLVRMVGDVIALESLRNDCRFVCTYNLKK